MTDKMICYCFQYTEDDIIEDYRENGHSRILRQIQREKALGGCRCEHLNPKGR
jgi:hypothetical protein